MTSSFPQEPRTIGPKLRDRLLSPLWVPAGTEANICFRFEDTSIAYSITAQFDSTDVFAPKGDCAFWFCSGTGEQGRATADYLSRMWNWLMIPLLVRGRS